MGSVLAALGQSLSSIWTQTWNGMADLAEAVDDLICSFDYSYADAAMDSLVMFIFFWVIFALFSVFVVKWAYAKYKSGKTAVAEPAVTQPKKVEADDTTRPSVANEAPPPVEAPAKPKAAGLPVSAAGKPPMAPKATGGVLATPPNRKRIGSRMSPAPEAQSKKHGALPPTCVGADQVASRWASNAFAWLYSDLVVVNDLLQLWILAMNEYSKKSVEEHGVGVELVRVLTETPVPKISNVFCECDSKDDVTITCDCEATPALQLKAFRQKGDKVEALHYRVNVNRFRARLRVLIVTEKLTGEFKCDGWPDVKIALAPVGPIRSNPDEQQLQEVISEIVVSALRSTQVEFSLAHYPTCPRLRRMSETPSRLLPMHYDSMLNQNPLYSSTPTQHDLEEQLLAGDKRLLVKVVSAQKLGKPTAHKSPYCVVEMDEPPQRNQTSVKKDTNDPYWDEHFLFDLSPHTTELLFEVFDKGSGGTPVFLGLGIVGVDELLINPSQRQMISLQSRPLEDDSVTGVLTVEFLFIEGADIPLTEGRPFKIKETLKTTSPSGQTMTTTRTMYKQNDVTMNGTAPITESALKELERSPSTQANKSTLIIHSVQRTPKQLVKVEMTASGNFIEVEQANSEMAVDDGLTDEAITENVENTENVELTTTPLSRNDKKVTVDTSKNKMMEEKNGSVDTFNGSNIFGQQKQPGDVHLNPVAETNGQPPERIPRQKKRKDFFGNIKKRLGRSRTRARSVDIPDSGSEDQPNYRSVSADRHNDSVPSPTRNSMGRPSAPGSPAQSGDESRASRRSSISEMSAVSGASTRTYLHEASTLVLETVDNGVKKHFLVPLSIAQRSRWRRKGVKLHIFNDHTFVAKHLSGSVVCQVCNKNIARRIGKQGYECRDCLMKCHKHCHIRVLDNCPNSTIHTIELQYITSPFTDKNIRML